MPLSLFSLLSLFNPLNTLFLLLSYNLINFMQLLPAHLCISTCVLTLPTLSLNSSLHLISLHLSHSSFHIYIFIILQQPVYHSLNLHPHSPPPPSPLILLPSRFLPLGSLRFKYQLLGFNFSARDVFLNVSETLQSSTAKTTLV